MLTERGWGAGVLMTMVLPRPYTSSGHDRLITRLESISEMPAAARDLIRTLPIIIRTVAADSEICRDGDKVSESLLLIEGMLQRYKALPNGRRQILAFHVPGDIPDLQTLHEPVMDHTLASVTESRIGAIPHTALQRLVADNDSIRTALWREALIDAARFRQWIANLGGRNAYQRAAHLFCELYVRLRAVGLARSDGIGLPLTQAQLSEALGLSVVHVNRTLQALKKDGLIAMNRRTLQILDWERLQAAAEFQPQFLHLRRDTPGAMD